MPLADYIPAPAPLEDTRPQRACCGGGGCTSHLPPPESTRPDCEPEPLSEAVDEDPILLCCPECDEVFPPAFYRHCQQCGHDFGQGVSAPAVETVESNLRPLLVVFGLVAVGAGVLGYCWYLFQR